LTVCFGLSSWVTINGIFSILPLIIDRVPEGWAIASTLGLAVQAANVGPLVYRMSRESFAAIHVVVYAILGLGILSMLLLAGYWNVTAEILGARCSVVLVACTFAAALSDCTSSLVFWPFVGALSPAMVSGLALGESLSGVVASAVSWIGLTPSGSFCALAAVLLVSGAAFRVLAREAKSAANSEIAAATEALVARKADSPTFCYFVVGVMSLLENAVLPSVLPYATARYSKRDYHVASTIPVGSLALLSLVCCQPPRAALASTAAGAAGAVSIIVATGLGSLDLGSGATIFTVLLAKALLAYSKAASMYHLKVGVADSVKAQRNLEKAGGLMQVWSFGGAIIMFVLTRCLTAFPAQKA